jgi:hypothetical protein
MMQQNLATLQNDQRHSTPCSASSYILLSSASNSVFKCTSVSPCFHSSPGYPIQTCWFPSFVTSASLQLNDEWHGSPHSSFRKELVTCAILIQGIYHGRASYRCAGKILRVSFPVIFRALEHISVSVEYLPHHFLA